MRTTAGVRTSAPRLVVAALALLAVVALRWPDVLRAPFVNDDFLFLDRTRAASLPSLWGFDGLAFHWWRPWSRETHYWAVQGLAGANPAVFHAVNAALWLAVVALFWAFVRRIAGGRAAAWAAAACASLAAWSLPLLWVAGVQDLWMLVWSLAALLAWSADRRALALGGYAMALLSKETAALLPAVLLAHDVLLARRPWREAIARALPFAVVALAWGALHPRLGGQLWRPVTLEHVDDPTRLSPPVAFARGLLVALNLDRVPVPMPDWGAIAFPALALAGALLVLAGALRPENEAPAPHPRAAVTRFALAWAAVGVAPLLLPGLGFHAYYASFAALGVLLALGAWAGGNAAVAGVTLALLAVLGTARDRTPSLDWGDAMYQRRAAALNAAMRDDLLRKLPEPGAHARIFFVRVPDRIGLVQGDAPALRVWYGDSTLRGGFYSAYRPRAAGEPRGADYFFRHDSLAGWVRVHAGEENLEAELALNPRWVTDHRSLAAAFVAAGDYAAAATEHEKIAGVLAASSDAAFDAAASWAAAGDTRRAMQWASEAARRPDARPEVVQAAREAGLLPR
ncbi:MAG: hypothetical protein HZA61_09250 [Candidatus Eisenbacteria bacterium]|uniref:Uncharacterized protein n=1 Tax=Eiseniibacteriota bacterium TaxID=2212470 RepID=A0A933W970_UNCEI|nr:hypothetical protein [Candidatus Eisenbacteria bacterium]